MIKCPSCKTKLTPNAKFCYSCGLKMPEIDSDIDHDLEFLKRTLDPQIIEIQKIGQGGMGSIFLGKQVSLNRPVVIKLLNDNLALDKKIAENFLKEAQIPANIKHPNIVEMVDYGKAEGRPFFIMEYGAKGSLEKILTELRKDHRKLPSLQVCNLMVKILTALDFAHSKDLKAHRDIKPHNIILRESGDVFITDFGVAIRKQDKNINESETAGSIEYMSPEQINGSKDVDCRSDVYSMGILFFEMLTGSLPFESFDKEKIIEMHLHSDFPDLIPRFTKKELESIEKEEVPILQLQSIIRKACEKDKTKRYSSCKEMADAINAIIQKIAEENTVSFKSNRRKLTTYEFILCTLLLLVSYPAVMSHYRSICTKCCAEGNCVNGDGKFREDEKNYYEGRFENGEPNGNGIQTAVSKKGEHYRYIGEFKEGKITGNGTMILFADNNLEKKISRYSGGFKEGQKEGRGSIYFFSDNVTDTEKTASYFIGNFSQGKAVGEGVQYNSKTGKLYKGEIATFEKGNPPESVILPHGKGILILPSGKVIEGKFKEGKQQ